MSSRSPVAVLMASSPKYVPAWSPQYASRAAPEAGRGVQVHMLQARRTLHRRQEHEARAHLRPGVAEEQRVHLASEAVHVEVLAPEAGEEGVGHGGGGKEQVG